jgi:hypothetical protein
VNSLFANSGTPCVTFAQTTVAILPFIFRGSDTFGQPTYALHERLQTFAEPGETLGGNIDHTALVNDTVLYEVTLSGHLVSLP